MHVGGANDLKIYAHHIATILTNSNKENPYFFWFVQPFEFNNVKLHFDKQIFWQYFYKKICFKLLTLIQNNNLPPYGLKVSCDS
jgi:hypothetical protein